MRIPDSSAAATLAYEEIKRRIVDLECARDPALRSFARRRARVRHSPIRTAFARLQGEGWVTVSPQSGTYVKLLGGPRSRNLRIPPVARDARHARGRAEHHRGAARGVAPGVPAPHAPGRRKRFDKRMFDDINDLDALFHATVYRAAGNSLVTGILLNLFEKVTWLKKTTPSSPERMQKWSAELRSVLKALEKRDPDAAARRMREHMGHTADSGSKYAARMPRNARRRPRSARFRRRRRRAYANPRDERRRAAPAESEVGGHRRRSQRSNAIGSRCCATCA